VSAPATKAAPMVIAGYDTFLSSRFTSTDRERLGRLLLRGGEA